MADVKFTKTHEWIRVEDGTATIGISEYAQKQLGDVVFVGLPEEEDEVSKRKEWWGLPTKGL